MDLLLDTHAFLWIAGAEERLSQRARSTWLDQRNRAFLSHASVWEIAIKASLGKLALPMPLRDLVAEGQTEQGIVLLPIGLDDVLKVQELPFHHRDPFDRLLVAQALSGRLSVLGCDEAFDAYGVRRIW